MNFFGIGALGHRDEFFPERGIEGLFRVHSDGKRVWLIAGDIEIQQVGDAFFLFPQTFKRGGGLNLLHRLPAWIAFFRRIGAQTDARHFQIDEGNDDGLMHNRAVDLAVARPEVGHLLVVFDHQSVIAWLTAAFNQ